MVRVRVRVRVGVRVRARVRVRLSWKDLSGMATRSFMTTTKPHYY